MAKPIEDFAMRHYVQNKMSHERNHIWAALQGGVQKFFRIIGVLTFCMGAVSCGAPEEDTVVPNSNGCPPGVAQVWVGDGFLRVICGCQEAVGTQALPPQSLTCTVPAGTLVGFQYLATRQKHQIAPTDGRFPLSPLSDPSRGSDPKAYFFRFETAGSFPFYDLYLTTLSGTVVVN